jgi:hypothetical protein
MGAPSLPGMAKCERHNMYHKDSGVLFVVTGAHYTAAAGQAARSVAQTNPWLKIGIFSDQEVTDPVFSFVGKIQGEDSRRKHEYVGLSPFSKTLYLDSDVRVVDDLSDLFRLLERYEMAGAHVRYRSVPKRLRKNKLDLPQAFPQINCGVLLYRKCGAVDALFKLWNDIYVEGGFSRDQIPFREALWQSDVRFYVFGPEYNMRNIPVWQGKQPPPVILHIHAYHSHSFFAKLALRLLLIPHQIRLRKRKKFARPEVLAPAEP